MSTQYLKITLTSMATSGSYPSPPNILYIPYPLNLADRFVGTVFWSGQTYTFDVFDFPVGRPIDIQYRSYWALPSHWDYAELHENFCPDFAAAITAGNLSGSYVGRKGATWEIDHVLNDGTVPLPSGSGGEAGTIFTQDPPANPTPNKATNPSPADEAVTVRLGTAKLDWDAG